MHIYFFGVYNAQGGMENYALNLIKGIKSKHPEIEFTLLVFKDIFSGKDIYLKDKLCDYVILPDFKRHPFLFLKKFKQIESNVSKFDIIQLNVCTFRNFLLFYAASKMRCRKIIVSHYSKNDDGFAILHYINRMLFHKKFENIAVSVVSGNFMFKKDFKVIPNGVISDFYTFDYCGRDIVRNLYKINKSDFLIGQVGRITKEKNQYFSLRVLKELCKSNKNVKMILVGKYYNNKLQNYIDKIGLSNNVILTGPIYRDINFFYSAFDCFILPSKNEAMGIALVESLCNGLPTIYSRNVPSLDVKDLDLKGHLLKSLDLNVDLWKDEISKIMSAEKKKRINYIKGTKYELSCFVDSYYNYYTNNN